MRSRGLSGSPRPRSGTHCSAYSGLRGPAGRSDLFAFLRSPYSSLARSSADFVEGRLRGRAISMPERVEEEVRSLRSASIPPLDALRVAETPVAGVTALVQSMLRAAHGLERPPVGDDARNDLRALEASVQLMTSSPTGSGSRASE